MYRALTMPIPCRVQSRAFTNGVGLAEDLVDALIVSVSDDLELVVEHDGCRFYDVPLRMTGSAGGAVYKPPGTREGFVLDPEVNPRRVRVYALPWASNEVGTAYATLTWVGANLSYLLIVLDDGTVILWPPHKITWGGVIKPLPPWSKRRYEGDEPYLRHTHVEDASAQEHEDCVAAAKQALSTLDGWRPHGIGLIQKYVGEDKDYRVHVWTPSAVQVGLINGGIHDHRYSFRSVVLVGSISHEEWEASPSESGAWRRWEYDNSTSIPSPEGLYDLSPRTVAIRAGQAYDFDRAGVHRTLPMTDVVVTVIRRFGVGGDSSTYVVDGILPKHGGQYEQDVPNMINMARKHLGMRSESL